MLKTFYLGIRKIKIYYRFAIIKFKVKNGGGDGTSCFDTKINTYVS